MASGFGYNGQNRCFTFWQDFEKCILLTPEANRIECKNKGEDYYECLHHFKEAARVRVIQATERKNFTEARQIGAKHKILDLSDPAPSS